MQLKVLTLMDKDLDFNWLPLKYFQVEHLKFDNPALLKVLYQQNIVMPHVCSVTFFEYEHEAANTKLILEKIRRLFPSVNQIYFPLTVYVQEKNEPIRNHELFTLTCRVFDTFKSILVWKKRKLNVTIGFHAHYNGPINEELARKMTEYIGYAFCYMNDKVRSELSMSNVDLTVVVKPE
ncbi:unnamed protein product [Bursaphelenchus okinawaensis]|uniref:Uncharacterized protein n=1 Tax=Bursaphelenchus okinawaensis TaxID=465554 RepID=A0A811LTX5_9BILA|nr:unnamed protein product [Bursaphelenchus okinawaensis]CAG9127782.1 unnamed protein product [Bursaphelenchus okinawaensis]